MRLSYEEHLARAKRDRRRAMNDGTWLLIGLGSWLLVLLRLAGIL